MANVVDMKLTPGRETGTRPSRRLRAEDHIPGVLYGEGFDPVSITVERRELRAALTTDAGLNALLNLQLGEREQLALVRELQQDPVKHKVIHVDFLAVDADKPLRVDVPVHTVGESELVNNAEGGTIDQVLHSITVLAKPHEIPNELTVDVSSMDIGDSIRVGDLDLPGEVTTDVDPEEPVAVAKIVTVEVPEPTEGEEAEGAEGEEAEGAGDEEASEDGGDAGSEEGDGEG